MSPLRKTSQGWGRGQVPPLALGATKLRCALFFGFAMTVLGSAGCGNQSFPDQTGPPAHEELIDGPVMTELPPPATDRIEYNSQTRTLTFYELPRSGRWMVRRADTPIPDAVGPDHRLPEGVDPEQTFVYYSRPGGQRSRPVTLAQIQAARQMHASN